MQNQITEKITFAGFRQSGVLTEAILREGLEDEVSDATSHEASDTAYWGKGMSLDEALSALNSL